MDYPHINRCKRCRTPNPKAFSSGLDYLVKCQKCGKEIHGRGDFTTAILKWNNTRKGISRRKNKL